MFNLSVTYNFLIRRMRIPASHNFIERIRPAGNLMAIGDRAGLLIVKDIFFSQSSKKGRANSENFPIGLKPTQHRYLRGIENLIDCGERSWQQAYQLKKRL